MGDTKLYAVITGDVVDSSKIGDEHHTLLIETLKHSFEVIAALYSGNGEKLAAFDIFRGDSFQGLLHDPADALAASLAIRASLRKNQPGGASHPWDARTALGIGTISYLPGNVSEGDGEAYRRSGPRLDRMKTGQRLSIVTPWEEANEEFAAQSALLDAVIAKWSPQHAEIVLELLEGKSRKAIGKAFDISQAAVHYRVKGAGWFAVEKFLQRYRELVESRSRE